MHPHVPHHTRTYRFNHDASQSNVESGSEYQLQRTQRGHSEVRGRHVLEHQLETKHGLVGG